MKRPPRVYPAGFTLVELLIVIAIIGVMAAILLPALQGAFDQGRRARFSNHIDQLENLFKCRLLLTFDAQQVYTLGGTVTNRATLPDRANRREPATKTATMENGVTYEPTGGRWGLNGCLTFDGVDDYLDMGSAPEGSITADSKDWTVCTWVRPTVLNDWNTILSTGREANWKYNLILSIRSDGRLHMHLWTGKDRWTEGDPQQFFGQPGDVKVNQWNFIAVRFNRGVIEAFINDNKYSYTLPSQVWDTNTEGMARYTSPFVLGTDPRLSDRAFTGSIDEVAVFNDDISDDFINSFRNCAP